MPVDAPCPAGAKSVKKNVVPPTGMAKLNGAPPASSDPPLSAGERRVCQITCAAGPSMITVDRPLGSRPVTTRRSGLPGPPYPESACAFGQTPERDFAQLTHLDLLAAGDRNVPF